MRKKALGIVGAYRQWQRPRALTLLRLYDTPQVGKIRVCGVPISCYIASSIKTAYWHGHRTHVQLCFSSKSVRRQNPTFSDHSADHEAYCKCTRTTSCLPRGVSGASMRTAHRNRKLTVKAHPEDKHSQISLLRSFRSTNPGLVILDEASSWLDPAKIVSS